MPDCPVDAAERQQDVGPGCRLKWASSKETRFDPTPRRVASLDDVPSRLIDSQVWLGSSFFHTVVVLGIEQRGLGKAFSSSRTRLVHLDYLDGSCCPLVRLRQSHAELMDGTLPLRIPQTAYSRAEMGPDRPSPVCLYESKYIPPIQPQRSCGNKLRVFLIPWPSKPPHATKCLLYILTGLGPEQPPSNLLIDPPHTPSLQPPVHPPPSSATLPGLPDRPSSILAGAAQAVLHIYM